MCAALCLWLASSAEVRDLPLGVPVRVELDLEQTDLPAFRVRVPPRATALRVRTSGASHDVLLYGSRGAEPDPASGDWEVTGPGVWLDEDVLIDVTDAVPLDPGDWYFVIEPAEPAAEHRGERLSVDLVAELIQVPRVELALGRTLELTLARANGMRVALVPPAGVAQSELRLEAFSYAADVELLVGPALRDRPHRSPWASSETPVSWERITLTPEWLAEGALVHLFARPECEGLDEIPVRVVLAPAGAPLALVPEPLLAERAEALAAAPFGPAVAATVCVLGPLGGGSGVVLSPDGLVVTNAHVVEGARPGDGSLACGFTLDSGLPPVPAFRLRLVDCRRDLDLALLAIEGTLDGGALPAGMRFPAIPLAPFDAQAVGEHGPALGDPLWGIGFPMTGGSGSYVTVTLTRGILSGFAREHEGLLFKTDAAIHSGISGGAVLDDLGRLVGIPCSSISDANMAGGLGFALPLALLPAEWRAALVKSNTEGDAGSR